MRSDTPFLAFAAAAFGPAVALTLAAAMGGCGGNVAASPADAGPRADDASPIDSGTSTAPDAGPPNDAGPTTDASPSDASSSDARSEAGAAATVLATKQTPHFVAVDDTNVYWSNDLPIPAGTAGNAQIVRCAIGGCAQQPTVVWAAEYAVDALAIEDGQLFWPTVEGLTPGQPLSSPEILSCPVGGCGSSASVFFVLQNSDVEAFAAAPASIAWASNANGDVVACPPAGCNGSPTLIGSDPSTLMASGSLAAGPTAFVWIDYAGNVQMCPKSGCTGAPTTIATGVTFQSGIVVDADHAYWVALGDRMGGGKSPITEYTGGAVVSCPLTGCGASPTVLVGYPSWLGSAALAFDGTTLYWSAEDVGGASGEIARCPVAGCGGTPEVLATTSGTAASAGLAVDAAHVYWSDPGAGQVLMRAK